MAPPAEDHVPPSDHERRVSPRGRTTLLAVGALLFVVGLLIFAATQSQAVFKDTLQSGVTSGNIPRNDGGIAFGGLVAASGAALLVIGSSPLPRNRALRPALTAAGSLWFLLLVHFSVLVNAAVVPRARTAQFHASLILHGGSDYLPIALFVMVGITLAALIALALSLVAAWAPGVYHRHVRQPDSTASRRATLGILTLLITALTAGFIRQNLGYALVADSDGTGTIVNAYAAAFYYVLSALMVTAVGLTGWRSLLLLMGDLRAKRSLTYERRLGPLLRYELWTWAALSLLSVTIAAIHPIMPDEDISRTFAVNSRGVAFFQLGLPALVALHRRTSRRYLHWLRNTHNVPAVPTDRVVPFMATTTAVWGAMAIINAFTTTSALVDLLLRVALVAPLPAIFALRIDYDLTKSSGGITVRDGAGPPLLGFGLAIAMLAGIMLWGLGNTVQTTYSAAGGFIENAGDTIRPYAVGFRFLSSLFIAAPMTFLLGLYVRSNRPAWSVGPLAIAGFSIIIGMNLLLPINAEDIFDNTLSQRDVIIGYRLVGQSAFDVFAIGAAFTAVTLTGVFSLAHLLTRHHGLTVAKPRLRRAASTP